MRNLRAWSAAAVGAVGIASCVTEPDVEELSKQTIVVTQQAPGTNFASYTTFAINDQIPITTANEAGVVTTPPTVDPSLATPTIAAIASELTSRGYQRVDRTQGPDLGVQVTAVLRVNALIQYGLWWGSGGTGTFWGYNQSQIVSGLAPTGGALWESGALVMELYDLRAARAAQGGNLLQASTSAPAIPVVWAGFVYGVIGPLGSTLSQPPIAGIQQAFAQSPYLRRNP